MSKGGTQPTSPDHRSDRPTGLTAIILAAGEGTRMRSSIPKVLHRIAGRTLIGHAVRAAAQLRPEQLVVVVGHGRQAVTEQLATLAEQLGRPVLAAVQEQQQGTGHAVSCALDAVSAEMSGTVLVSYGDVPLLESATLAELLAEHAAAGNSVTVLTALVADPTGYGRVLRMDGASTDSANAVVGIVEQADTTAAQREIREINSGVYAFEAAVLADALARLSSDNAQGERYLPDVLAIARAGGGRVGALVCADAWQVAGVNDRVQLAEMGAEFNRRLTRRWMRSGVTMIDPSTTWLDADVTLEREVTLEPGVQLRGRTTVGTGAVIGPDSTLVDVEVGAGASVVRTHGTGARIGAGASVGPFAYLRPGAWLGEAGKIGTFVEVKNSQIGAGTKVPHLTYVGDATIGEHSNIGAASVFVNYDGVTKRRSVIGSHVHTGSDNTFVAPVTVGDGAYSGAGAVIRRDVPPGALAVSGGPQRNFEGWVFTRRPDTPAAQAAQYALDEQRATSTAGAEKGQ